MAGHSFHDEAWHIEHMGAEVMRLFAHAPNRLLETGKDFWIGLSGEPGCADLNMAGLGASVSDDDLDRVVKVIRDTQIDTIIVAPSEGSDLKARLEQRGIETVGQVPCMERPAGPFDRPAPFKARKATAAEMAEVMDVSARAFSLDIEKTSRSMPAEFLRDEGNEVWLVEEDGKILGTGVFMRTDDHLGVYVMATPEEHRGRGVGTAVLQSAIEHHQESGLEFATLGATEMGYPVYEKLGFRTVAQPYVAVIGASTQFS